RVTQLNPTTKQPDNQTIVLMGNATTAVNDLYSIQLASPPTNGNVTVDVRPQDSQVYLTDSPDNTTNHLVTDSAALSDAPGLYHITFTPTNWSVPFLVVFHSRNIATPQDPHDTPIIQSIDPATTDTNYLLAAPNGNQRLDVQVISDK